MEFYISKFVSQQLKLQSKKVIQELLNFYLKKTSKKITSDDESLYIKNQKLVQKDRILENFQNEFKKENKQIGDEVKQYGDKLKLIESQMHDVEYENSQLKKKQPRNLGGNDPYLCSHDLKELKDRIIDATSNGVPMDCDSVPDEAKSLKINRLLEGMKFLSSVNSYRLSSDLSEFIIRPPTRQWINLIIDELDLHIINQRLIDQKRLDSCSISTIDVFFTKYGDFISQFHPIMIFSADETMFDPQPRYGNR